MQKEKDPSDNLRGGREKTQKGELFKRKGLLKSNLQLTHSVAVSDTTQWWVERDIQLPCSKKHNILTGTKTNA